MQENYQKDLKTIIEEVKTNTKTGLTTEEIRRGQEQ